jgi:ATP-dependent DNA helicase RecG
MKQNDILSRISLGEDSTRQFKTDVHNAESLAAEMAAFANTNGGTILIGAADDGSLPGLSRKDVGRINQLISNAASQGVRSPLTVTTENVGMKNGRIVIVLQIPQGIDRPYFDKDGVIWLKTGSDKRRVNSKEELRRLFQLTSQFHADELPSKAGIDKLDKLRFRDFLRDVYKRDYPDSPEDLTRLLQNMNLAASNSERNFFSTWEQRNEKFWAQLSRLFNLDISEESGYPPAVCFFPLHLLLCLNFNPVSGSRMSPYLSFKANLTSFA